MTAERALTLLVDSNVLLDVMTEDPRWSAWSGETLAGKCFVWYRRRRGARTSPLPDFWFGAHAAVAGLVMLTRDPRRYRTYFPALEIIAPQE